MGSFQLSLGDDDLSSPIFANASADEVQAAVEKLSQVNSVLVHFHDNATSVCANIATESIFARTTLTFVSIEQSSPRTSLAPLRVLLGEQLVAHDGHVTADTLPGLRRGDTFRVQHELFTVAADRAMTAETIPVTTASVQGNASGLTAHLFYERVKPSAFEVEYESLPSTTYVDIEDGVGAVAVAVRTYETSGTYTTLHSPLSSPLLLQCPIILNYLIFIFLQIARPRDVKFH